MSAIPPLLEELSGNSVPGSSGQLSKQKAKWLYELERAQWDIKQRPQTLGHNLLRTNIAESSAHTRSATVVTNKQAEKIEGVQSRSPQLFASRQPIIESRVLLANPSIEANPIQQTAAFVAAGPLPLNAVSGADRHPISSIAFGISSNPAQRHWDKQRAHLEEKDGEVRLWLRDTRMGASQGLELAMALRKCFAELGVKLARFTLNGQSYDQLNSFQQTPISNQ